MAKVIAEANENPNLWKKQVTCTGEGWDQEGKVPCRRLIEIDERDVQYRNHTDYAGDTDTYYGFTCPACKCFTELMNSSIPTRVKSQAIEYTKPCTNN